MPPLPTVHGVPKAIRVLYRLCAGPRPILASSKPFCHPTGMPTYHLKRRLDYLVQIVVWYIRKEVLQNISRLGVYGYLRHLRFVWVLVSSISADAMNGHNIACCCERQSQIHTHRSNDCTRKVKTNPVHMLREIVCAHVGSCLEREKVSEYRWS